MKEIIHCSAIRVNPEVTLYHTGPALDHGPLPSFFYFSLSGPDSLTLDPFNQIVQFLRGQMIRVFSLTLPGHEANLSPHKALSLWAEDFSRGVDCIGNFLDQTQTAIDFAIKEKFVKVDKMATGGLSRGGFIAAHLAAREPRFRFLLGVAPLTRLDQAREFSDLHNNPLLQNYSLDKIAGAIADRHIRFYIGNEDTRVSTRACFDFAMQIVEKKQTRTSQVELFISPSIGQMGHGTPPEVFKQGADWISTCLT